MSLPPCVTNISISKTDNVFLKIPNPQTSEGFLCLNSWCFPSNLQCWWYDFHSRWLRGKELPANGSRCRRCWFDPGLARSPGEGNDNPLQYSCLVNPMDRRTWWAIVYQVTKSWTWLSRYAHVIQFIVFLLKLVYFVHLGRVSAPQSRASLGELCSGWVPLHKSAPSASSWKLHLHLEGKRSPSQRKSFARHTSPGWGEGAKGGAPGCAVPMYAFFLPVSLRYSWHTALCMCRAQWIFFFFLLTKTCISWNKT